MENIIKEKDRIISEEKAKNKELNKTIEELKEKNEKLNKKIEELQNEFKKNDLVNDILELKNKMQQYELYISSQKLILIKIISVDQVINFYTIAKINDKFTEIENIIYNNYPEYKETENFFLVNGNMVDKSKSLQENKIKMNDVLTLSIVEVDEK